jgi:hypothetical protein
VERCLPAAGQNKPSANFEDEHEHEDENETLAEARA